MTPEEVRQIVREARRAVDAEWSETQQRVRQERLAAIEAEAAKKSPADLIADEWDEVDRVAREGWVVGRR